jgi:hypothetical protein
VRLIDEKRDAPVRKVTAYLTLTELRDLYQTLAYLFEEEGPGTDPEWHAHVTSTDIHAYELTIGLQERRPGLEDKWVRFFDEDVW